MANITKRDLIVATSIATGHSFTDCRKVCETAMTIIVDQIKSGLSVELRGFGTFYPKARKMSNIHTGKDINVPARNAMGFTPCERLRNFEEKHCDSISKITKLNVSKTKKYVAVMRPHGATCKFKKIRFFKSMKECVFYTRRMNSKHDGNWYLTCDVDDTSLLIANY